MRRLKVKSLIGNISPLLIILLISSAFSQKATARETLNYLKKTEGFQVYLNDYFNSHPLLDSNIQWKAERQTEKLNITGVKSSFDTSFIAVPMCIKNLKNFISDYGPLRYFTIAKIRSIGYEVNLSGDTQRTGLEAFESIAELNLSYFSLEFRDKQNSIMDISTDTGENLYSGELQVCNL